MGYREDLYAMRPIEEGAPRIRDFLNLGRPLRSKKPEKFGEVKSAPLKPALQLPGMGLFEDTVDRYDCSAVFSIQRRRCMVESTFLIMLVACGFLVRLLPIARCHFWDETVYLQNAEVICCGKSNYSELDNRPPLLSLIFAATFFFGTVLL